MMRMGEWLALLLMSDNETVAILKGKKGKAAGWVTWPTDNHNHFLMAGRRQRRK